MIRRLRVALWAVPAVGLALAAGIAEAADSAPAQWNLVQRYCTECHNVQDWAGGVAFDSMSPDQVPTETSFSVTVTRISPGKFGSSNRSV